MPNWCYTVYNFHGNNRKTVLNLYDSIVKWMNASSTPYKESSLGNILTESGYINWPQNKIDHLSFRGDIVALDVPYSSLLAHPDCRFKISTESAWVPAAMMWLELLKFLGLDNEIKFSFRAEESGAGIYVVYDPFNYEDFEKDEFHIKWVLNPINNTADLLSKALYDIEYISGDDLRRILAKGFNKPDASLNELLKMVDDFNHSVPKFDNSFISIQKFEYIDDIRIIDDFD